MIRLGDESMYQLKDVNGKKVFIVESHHHALLPWSHIKREVDGHLILISLDHHTDCMPAFNAHRCIQSKSDDVKYEQMLDSLLSDFNYRDDGSVIRAINKLRYDEQIHTAILGGIFTHSFSINYSDQTPSIEERMHQNLIGIQFRRMLDEGIPLKEIPKFKGPYTYEKPRNGMFTIASDCYLGCNKMPHDDECLIRLYADAIESDFLNYQLAVVSQMSETSGLGAFKQSQYVLDIDLDYFHSDESIKPKDSKTFNSLIRNAQALTVAMERGCVETLKLEGEQIDSEILLVQLLDHIHNATT